MPSVHVDEFDLINGGLEIVGWAINEDSRHIPPDVYVLIGDKLFDTQKALK